jgi:hypothetical protein
MAYPNGKQEAKSLTIAFVLGDLGNFLRVTTAMAFILAFDIKPQMSAQYSQPEKLGFLNIAASEGSHFRGPSWV